MAFPKLLQKLFTNGGAGDKLNQDIIPDIPYSKITDAPSIDSALSSTSENPVQNKVINSALNSVSEKADNSGYQVGDIKLYAGSDVPDGWFRCDGSTIADMATNYPKLYAVLGTYVLPNYSGRYPLGAVSGIGTNVSAGLPNIEGRISFHGSLNESAGGTVLNSARGAFTTDFVQNGFKVGSLQSGAKSYGAAVFSAAASNAIYGDSTTVTPPSVKCAFLIRHD